MASWTAQATARPARVAQPRPRRAPPPRPRPRPQAAPRPRPRTRPRVAGGVLLIAVVAGLLAGIVALNVAVLRLNVEVEELDRKRASLIARNAELASDLSTAAAAGRVEELAQSRLGLVPPEHTTYVRVPRPGR
jgi:cell division protein FtsL